MSAFMVDKEHVNVLVAVGLRGVSGQAVSPDTAWHGLSWWTEDNGRQQLDFTTADAVGEMLVTTNFESICARYPDVMVDPGNTPGPIEQYWQAPYRWVDPRVRLTPVEALKAIECYEYQSCEHEGWKESEAHAFCEALRHQVIDALPGMREAPWDWKPEDIAARRGGKVSR